MKKKEKYYDGDRLDKNNCTSDRFLAINSCGVHTFGPRSVARTVRENGRVDYNLVYVECGILEAEFDNEEVCITAGGFILYPPGMRQDYQQSGATTYWVHFTGTAVEELLSSAGLLGVHSYQGKKHEPRITRILEKMLFHSIPKPEKSETALVADLTELIAELERMIRQETLRRTDDRLRHIILQMNYNYAKEIDLDAHAKSVGMSRSRFCHLFKEVTGCAPHTYILDLRLDRATELLLSTDDPISQIAYAVGYTDPFYFSRLFKKKYGLSPAQFRKK